MLCRLSSLIGLAAALSLGGSARAETVGPCVWSKLSPAQQTHVLAAYQQSMAAGAAALGKLGSKLKSDTARCARRTDLPGDWGTTIAGAEAVQTYASSVLKTPRSNLDAAWAAAPAKVTACVRANGRLAFYPNGLGCADPTAAAWLLKQIGIDRNQQPSAQQATDYFNAKAISEWGDQLVAKLPPTGR